MAIHLIEADLWCLGLDKGYITVYYKDMTNQEIINASDDRKALIAQYDSIDALTRGSLTARPSGVGAGMIVYGSDFPAEIVKALEEIQKEELAIESNLMLSVGFEDAGKAWEADCFFYCPSDSIQGVTRKANGNYNLENSRLGKTRTFRSLGALVIFLKDKNIYEKVS